MTTTTTESELHGGRRTGFRWVGEHLRQRRWAIAAIVVFTLASMAYTLFWGPVVRHQAIWVVPGDVWYTFRVSHLIGWGDIGGAYDPTYGQLTFPGAAALLAPVAMVGWHFHLSESIGLLTVPRPTAWLVLGPAVILLGSACLAAFDALAEELDVGAGRRIALLSAESSVVFVVVTMWGHPEDLVATGLAAYALLANRHGRWNGAGWLWGVAIAFQPLVLVVFPLALAATPAGRRVRVCMLAIVPTAGLMAGPLLTQWGMTTRSLLHQANDPLVNHATPWIALSTRVDAMAVTAGPGRIITLVLAAGLGLFALRRRPSFEGLLWLAALALSLRCFVEAVMVPFYLGPPFALIVLACAVRPSRLRLVVGSTAFVVASVISLQRLSEWAYWLPISGLLILGLASAFPGRSAFRTTDAAEATVQSESAPADPSDALVEAVR